MPGAVPARRIEMDLSAITERPEYAATHPSPEIDALLKSAAARKTVWLHPDNGQPFWLSHELALKALAAQGGKIFPPVGAAA